MGGLPWFRPQYVSSVVGNTAKQKSTGCRMVLHRAFPIVLRLTDGKPVKAASSTKDSNVSEEVSGRV